MIRFQSDTTMSQIILDRPLYFAEDQKTIVEEGDPRASFVLGGAGSIIKGHERFGLVADENGIVSYGEPVSETAGEEPDGKALDGPPKTKAIKGPKETK
jgi:fructose-1,6-bisphosphatase